MLQKNIFVREKYGICYIYIHKQEQRNKRIKIRRGKETYFEKRQKNKKKIVSQHKKNNEMDQTSLNDNLFVFVSFCLSFFTNLPSQIKLFLSFDLFFCRQKEIENLFDYY